MWGFRGFCLGSRLFLGPWGPFFFLGGGRRGARSRPRDNGGGEKGRAGERRRGGDGGGDGGAVAPEGQRGGKKGKTGEGGKEKGSRRQSWGLLAAFVAYGAKKERGLVFELGLEELAVEASDVGDGDTFGALGFAGTGVGAVAETEFVHLGNHCFGAASCLDLPLREEGELANLGRDEEHGGAVFAGGSAGSTADAGCSVHGGVGVLFGNGECVGVLSGAAADASVATGLHDLVVGRAVDHEVADDGEAS